MCCSIMPLIPSSLLKVKLDFSKILPGYKNIFSTLQTIDYKYSPRLVSLIISFVVADLPIPALLSFGGRDRDMLTELQAYLKFMFSIN